MPPKLPCPDSWDYENYPAHKTLLPARTIQILGELRQDPLTSLPLIWDSRIVHKRMFTDLTPVGHDQFAGHYRGQGVACLVTYKVQIKSDPRVGDPPERVARRMGQLETAITDAIEELDQAEEEEPKKPSAEFLLDLVKHACVIFERFLEIHPYANGNGHAGRFILIAFLGKYGYWMKDWEINERPKDPPYSTAIKLHRDGEVEHLQKFVLQSLITP